MKRIRDTSGFSLISAMVAAGITVIVGLGFASMLSSMNRQANLVGTRFDKIGLTQDLRTSMAEASTCTRVFGGGTQPMSSAPNSVTEIRANLAPPGQPPLLVQTGQDLLAYNIKVRRFFVQNPVSAGIAANGTRLFMADVILEADELTGASANAWSFRSARIGSAYFEMPAGSDVIQRCYTLETQSDLLESACAKFGGVFNPATRQCDTLANDCGRLGGVWNASTKTCKVTPSPAEACAALGGVFNGTACQTQSLDKKCAGPYPAPAPGGFTTQIMTGEATSGTKASDGRICVSGVWVPIPTTAVSDGDAGGDTGGAGW